MHRFALIGLALLVGGLAGCRSASQPSAPTSEELGGQVEDVAQPAFDAARVGATGKLTVFVPCGMIIPVKKAVTVFRESNPGLEVTEDYDNASVLVAKILERGAKTDVFVSPGVSEIEALEEAGLIDPESKRCLGSFELVVITRRDGGTDIARPEDLLECETIAIPEPGVNSVGTSGREALTNLGLWEQLEPRLLRTDQAIKSHNYVKEGKADVGISYKACPLETNPEKMNADEVRIACEFPADCYERQRIWVAPLTDSANPGAAKALVEFLVSEAGLTVLNDGEHPLPGAAELLAEMQGAAPAEESADDA